MRAMPVVAATNVVWRSAGDPGEQRTLAALRPTVWKALTLRLSTVRRWHAIARQRRQLRALASDEGFLADIGISYVDALQEANKPFWKR